MPRRCTVNILSKWCALSAFAVLGLVAPSASAQVIPGANANGLGNFSEGFQAHERTGDASYSYDFALPAARGGKVTPSLSLVYSSSNGVGDAGDGFRLSMPTIEAESVPYGAPATMVPYGRWSYSGQALVKVCNASGCVADLASLPGVRPIDEVYRLRFDDAQDRFVKLGDGGWRVFHKDGLVDDYFATDADKSDEAPPRPVRFHLSERREWTASAGLGNRARYVWQVLGNRGLRYLTDTFDTPIAGTAPATDFAHHTKIYYESHDFEQTAYAPTWLAKPDMRIASAALLV
jgi:Salmonella virulence plasmid 65kDa B protein